MAQMPTGASKTSILGCFCIAGLFLLTAAQCSSPPSTAPTSTVQVAILTPMTGELASFGEIVRNGITLAFDEQNERGGINGQPIEWVLQDTACDPEQARRAAERVITEQGINLIVGGLCSEAAIPIARVADERGALFIAATATHPLVTVDEKGHTRSLVFRAGYAYPYQGRAAARFALDELDAHHAAALIDPGNTYSRSLADEFITAFAAGGGEITAKPTYHPQAADFEAIILDATQAKADVLYVPDGPQVVNRVAHAIQTQGLDMALIGSDLWDSDELDMQALEGDYFTLHYSRETPGSVAEDWRARYLSAFAIEPDTLAALGYEAGSLLAQAAEGTNSLSPPDVATQLESMEFQGLTGRWRFDGEHNPIEPVVVVRIEEGKPNFYQLVQP